MTRETFANCCGLMAELWPQTAPTPQALEVYWQVLQQLHDSVFEAAIAECLKSCTFYPKPAEIIAKSKEILTAFGALPGSGEQAWANLLRLMQHWSYDNGWCAPLERDGDGKAVYGRVGGFNGYYGAPSPLDELTEAAVRAVGGLRRIFDTSNAELGFIRKEFVSFYDERRRCEIDYNPALLSQALPAPKARPELAERATA